MNKEKKAYLGLGSNIGNRRDTIEQAIHLLGKKDGIRTENIADYFQTEPVGLIDQDDFINTVVEIMTSYTPHELLDIVKSVEKEMGRKPSKQWGPRNIDIDILFYGESIIVDSDLLIPHPLTCERVFVLKPMVDLNPNLKHPVFGKTLNDIYREREEELNLYHCLEL